jgi:hypothetical protein
LNSVRSGDDTSSSDSTSRSKGDDKEGVSSRNIRNICIIESESDTSTNIQSGWNRETVEDGISGKKICVEKVVFLDDESRGSSRRRNIDGRSSSRKDEI